MNFGRFDIIVLVTMSMAIIFMSFTFPALGMADSSNETSTGDIPRFNLTADRFDIVGDFPSEPSLPTDGTLTWVESGSDEQNFEFLSGSTQTGGVEAVLINFGDENNPDVEARLNFWVGDGSGPIITNHTLNGNVGETFTLGTAPESDTNYTVEFETVTWENEGLDNFTVETDYEVLSGPGADDDDVWTGIPVIGPLLGGAAELAGIIGWIATIIFWFFGTTIEIIVALILILVDLMVYTTALLHWLLGTYLGVVSAAGSWGAPILMIPAILLFAEFAKVAMIAISLLPTT